MFPVWIRLAIGTGLSAATLKMLPMVVPIVGVDHVRDLHFIRLILPEIVLTTILAALIPSNRASKVDPAGALRAN